MSLAVSLLSLVAGVAVPAEPPVDSSVGSEWSP